ncbi:MAG: hypothetical protein MJZ26_10245 [Fibrobacter sp.]|nr:hypothetical protein [Fibrobacter sp.]
MESVKTSNKRIVKNTAFLYLRMLLVMGVGLFSSRIVLQVLGVSDYGLYNAVGSIVVMFTIINGTLSSGTSRFLTFALGKGDADNLKKTFNAAFLMHVAIAFLVLILAETVGLWFLHNKMNIPAGRVAAANWLYQFSIVSCMLSMTQVPYGASIIAHERMKIYAWVGIAEAAWKICFLFILMYVPFSDVLIAYGALTMAWSCGLQIFYRMYCRTNFAEAKLSIVKDKSLYKSIASFSLWDLIGSFCATGNSQGLNLLINMFFGVTINAARGLAYQVENIIQQFVNNFMTAVNPQITKRYAEGRINDMMDLVFEGSKFGFYLLFMVTLPVFLEAPKLLSLWLVEVPENAVLFLRLLMLSMLIRAFARPVITAVHATGKIKFMNVVSGSTSVAVQIPGTYILFRLGCPAYVMFFVMMFVYVVCNYLELLSLKRDVDFSIFRYTCVVYLKCICLALLPAFVGLVIVSNIPSSIFRIVLTSVSTVSILAIMVLFLGISPDIRQSIFSKIRNKLRK